MDYRLFKLMLEMSYVDTYGKDDKFDHKSAAGFIYIWGLPSRIWAAANNKLKG